MLTREVAGHDNHGGGDEGGEDDDDDGVQTVVSRHQTMSFTAQRISGARASEGTVVLPSRHSGTASGGASSALGPWASSPVCLKRVLDSRSQLNRSDSIAQETMCECVILMCDAAQTDVKLFL